LNNTHLGGDKSRLSEEQTKKKVKKKLDLPKYWEIGRLVSFLERILYAFHSYLLYLHENRSTERRPI
jgi:hypothetical protein